MARPNSDDDIFLDGEWYRRDGSPYDVSLVVLSATELAALDATTANESNIYIASETAGAFQEGSRYVWNSAAGALEVMGGGGGGEGAGVSSVNSRSGAVILSKSDVGLANVDNTSDANKPVSTATTTALAAKAPLASPTFTGTVSGVTKTMVGLGNVDNTSDAAKPVSAATQTALNAKQDTLIAGTNITIAEDGKTISASGGGGASGVSSVNTRTGDVVLAKSDVGLANVDNTSDASKPVSTATQTALDGKQATLTDLDEVPGLTAALADKQKLLIAGTNIAIQPDGTISASGGEGVAGVSSVNTRVGDVVLSKSDVGLDNVDNTADTAKPVSTATQTALDAKAPLASPTFTGTVGGITKAMVGLANVDNTTDAAKPISTATQTALNLKANLASPAFTGTVTGITKAMVGLGSVDNTADTAKPVSTAQQTALNLKAPLASPTFTGVPAAPTAAGGTNTTQVATTAFVTAAVAAAPAPTGAILASDGVPASGVGANGDYRINITYPFIGDVYNKAAGAWSLKRNYVATFAELPAAGSAYEGTVITVGEYNCEFVCRVISGAYRWSPYTGWLTLENGRISTNYSSTFAAEETLATTTIGANLIYAGCILHIRALMSATGTAAVKQAVVRWNGGFAMANPTTDVANQTRWSFRQEVWATSNTVDWMMADQTAVPLTKGDGFADTNLRIINLDHTAAMQIDWNVKCTDPDIMRYNVRNVIVQYPQ